MSKATPGPWEAIGNAVHSDTWEIVFGAHMSRSAPDDEKRANARLIAAAPELRDALRECTDQLARFAGEHTSAVVRARAVLAKAGE